MTPDRWDWDPGQGPSRLIAELSESGIAWLRAPELVEAAEELEAVSRGRGEAEPGIHDERRARETELARPRCCAFPVPGDVADDGAGIAGEPSSGTGLSIVQALVRDELGGTLSLESNGGLRAEVVFAL